MSRKRRLFYYKIAGKTFLNGESGLRQATNGIHPRLSHYFRLYRYGHAFFYDRISQKMAENQKAGLP